MTIWISDEKDTSNTFLLGPTTGRKNEEKSTNTNAPKVYLQLNTELYEGMTVEDRGFGNRDYHTT